MIPYARLKPGPNFKPGRAALYYAQRFVTARAPRRAITRAIATGINVVHPASRANLRPGSAKSTADVLRRDGCTEVRPILSPAQLSAVLKYLGEAHIVSPSSNEEIPLSALPKGAGMASYPLKTVLNCDELLHAANDPHTLAVASDYLGCKPTISSLSVRWTFPRPDKVGLVQTFHRDCDDWRFLKMFIYLSDVDAGSGPHVYVKGTHNQPARWRAKPFSDQEIAQEYPGLEHTFLGPAGTSFMCDTYGIHKGDVPDSRPRLMFLVQYSVLPVYAFDYSKTQIEVAEKHGLDPYTNRLILA